ncbi:MAG: sugar-binding transcriptional regulator [Candidatus Promineifilaceae bacterium]|jgi:DNA-binding transcriptional regulator LsrR (DeoR family)
MANIDELRLMTRVARMYYERDMRQSDIAGQLGLSQATISRLLNRSRDEGIIRISVNVPQGVYSEMEEELVAAYDLRDAIVVDCISENEQIVQRDIGAAAAYYVESTIKPNEVIGLSSWSSNLLALVDAMHQVPRKPGVQVVQILGGVGNPGAEMHAARLTGRLARLVNGKATFLPAPGIVGSPASLNVLLADPYVNEAMALFQQVSLALVGIGTVEPSELLAESGNIFSGTELDILRGEGAVGDILLHFFDEYGQPIETSLNSRVISMSLPQLQQVDRAVGVAGGRRKQEAILGALRGNLINVLITDCYTAKRLLEKASR